MNSKQILLSVFLIICVTIGLYAQLPKYGWEFRYPGDDFNGDALLDLSYLNEDVAGENGFLGLSEDGNSFVDGEGNPMRLWCINGGGLASSLDDEELETYAKFMAKMGVNMIRFHGSINPPGDNSLITDVDIEEVDDVWRMVAAMKKEGIYSTICPFWPHNGHMGGWSAKWGIEGYETSDDLWGVLFFSDTLKAGYKAWVKYLYTETNPYTGIALKDDPSVGLIQVQNEDGVFFWTIQNVKEPIKKVMRQKFYNFLIDKYDSIEAAQSAWGYNNNNEDNPDQGEMGIYIVWYATQDRSGALDKRLSDQMEFMAKVQRDFYQEMYDYYRSIGCQQLINATNWKTANAARILDTERWTDAACEVIATNRYYDPGHTSPFGTQGWKIVPDDSYQGISALVQPNKLPINIKQPDGHPVLVTESGWNLPHKYQAEGPFLIAAYSSLTGVDGFYWFSPSASTYDAQPYRTWETIKGYQHPLSRWTMSTPGQLGMFPANALLYRKGYVAQGNTTVYEGRALQSMWDRKIPVITEEMGFDPNRDEHNPETEETEISSLAYLTGNVSVKYGTVADSSSVDPELSNLIDFVGKKVKSSTEELEWDYEIGICTMDAPSAQGVCGFVGTEGTFELSDVTIETENDYAAINVVSMDDNNLSESTKILIQVGTVYQPHAWTEEESESGYLIKNTGRMPWKCAKTLVKLTINNPVINKATVLDVAGYALSTVELLKSGQSVQLELPEDAMYVVLDNTTAAGETKLENRNMRIYPNPSRGTFSIELSDLRSANQTLEIRNALGQKVWEQRNISNRIVNVELDNVQPGLYFVRLKDGHSILANRKISLK